MQDSRLHRRPLYSLTLCAIICLLLSSPGTAQVCGNIDGDASGSIDISDLGMFVDNFLIFPQPISGPAELDGFTDVTLTDFLLFRQWIYCDASTPMPNGCIPPYQPPLDPPTRPGFYMAISDSVYPPEISGGIPITVGIYSQEPMFGATLSFRILVGGTPVNLPVGSITKYSDSTAYMSAYRDGTNAMLIVMPTAYCDPFPTGIRKLATIHVDAGLSTTPRPITVEQAFYPIPINPETSLPVHRSIMILGRFFGPVAANGAAKSPFPVDVVTPTVSYSLPCCQGITGNVDCDLAEATDIADLSALIDYLYISFSPLCCKQEANCDGSLDGAIDIADLTALIDYLYISFTPTASCL